MLRRRSPGSSAGIRKLLGSLAQTSELAVYTLKRTFRSGGGVGVLGEAGDDWLKGASPELVVPGGGCLQASLYGQARRMLE